MLEKEVDSYMEKSYRIVIELLHASVHQKKLYLSEIMTDEEWEEVIKVLELNRMLGVAYKTVEALPEEKKPSKEIMSIWKNKAFGIGIMQMQKNICIRNLLEESNRRGLTLVVFKGIPLAELYPEPAMRYSCDTDIYVYKEEKEMVEQLLMEQGFVHAGGKENVPDYVKDNKVKIELHSRLWEDYENEQTKFLDLLDITNRSKIICENYNGVKMYTLGYNEHFIFQMFHIIKHFSLEGVGIKYLLDVSLYVNKYIHVLDKEYFWKVMKQLNYDVFCDAFFKLAVEYFGMNNEILDEKYELKKYSDDLLDDIFMVGKLGDDDDSAWKVMHLLMPYYLQEREVPRSKWQRIRYIVFPKAEELTDYYSYAKRNRFLLPVAWVHRIINRVLKDNNKTEEDVDTLKKTKKVEHRLKLLNDMELTEK